MTSAEDRVPPVNRAAESEAELLRRVGSADPAAFEALYDLYGSAAYGVALRITVDEALSQDIVQDAFIAVWKQAARFDPARGSVKTWLLAIVHHRAIDEVRRRRKTEGYPEADDDPPPELTMPDIWGEVSERLDATLVREAFAGLPEPQQEVLRLAYFEGLTSEAIAARTRAPLGTVKSRIRLGLQGLRRRLADRSESPNGIPDGDGSGVAGTGAPAGQQAPAASERQR
jgi:RNA polymerase sigma-70 factor, ECF subfamily